MQAVKKRKIAAKSTGKSNNKSPWAALDTFLHETDKKLSKLTTRAVQTVDESHLTVHLGLMELDSSWEKFQSKLAKQVDTLRRLEGKAKAISGEARLQAHLAKEEVIASADRTRERVRLVERRLHSIKVKSESEASAALTRLSESCASLSRRLQEGTKGVGRTGASRSHEPEQRV